MAAPVRRTKLRSKRALRAEGLRDDVLVALVVRPRLLRELRDAVQRLLDPARRAVPLRPQLLEARLGDALPLALQRRDLGSELGQDRLDVRGTRVQLPADGLQLLGRDDDVRHAGDSLRGGSTVGLSVPRARALTPRASEQSVRRRIHSPAPWESRPPRPYTPGRPR